MYTVCPHCAAVFRVSATLLGTAAGQARCGECRQTYDVLRHLYEDPAAVQKAVQQLQAGAQAAHAPAAATDDAVLAGVEAVDVDEYVAEAADAADYVAEPANETHPVVAAEEITLDAIESIESTGSADSADTADADVTAAAGDDDELPVRHYPVLSGWQQHGIGMREVFGVFMSLLLIGVLGLQWVWFNRAQLAADPAWRAALEPVCGLLRCDLPLQVDLDKLALTARDIRRHPNVRSALLVNATFENQAGFAQPYPWLEIRFSDQAGAPVAVRRFSPAEYLGADVSTDGGIPASGTAAAALEIVDPGEAAVSFQFDFL